MDDEPLIRGHAAWALGQLTCEQNTDVIIQRLSGYLDTENDEDVLEEIYASIKYIRGKYDKS